MSFLHFFFPVTQCTVCGSCDRKILMNASDILADILIRRCPLESSFISTYHGKCRCNHDSLRYSFNWLLLFFFDNIVDYKSLNFNEFPRLIASRFTQGEENAHTKHLRQWNATDFFCVTGAATAATLVVLLGVFSVVRRNFRSQLHHFWFEYSHKILWWCVRWLLILCKFQWFIHIRCTNQMEITCTHLLRTLSLYCWTSLDRNRVIQLQENCLKSRCVVNDFKPIFTEIKLIFFLYHAIRAQIHAKIISNISFSFSKL